MEAAVLVCLQMARSMEAAHAAGIIHRDLKPSNVMLTPEGAVKVLDLGLAQLVGDEKGSDAALHGIFAGTLGYMSPEQIRGEQVDQATDIWGFGCVAFECASGIAAFAPDWGLAGPFIEPDWSKLPIETPPTFRCLIRRCLALDPQRRPASMSEICKTLEGILRSLFIVLPWTSAALNVPHWAGRRRIFARGARRTTNA